MRVDTPGRHSVSTLPNPAARLRPNSYHGHGFARKVSARTVRLHPRLAPSVRDVEELLAPPRGDAAAGECLTGLGSRASGRVGRPGQARNSSGDGVEGRRTDHCLPFAQGLARHCWRIRLPVSG
jgi:hypothetical protein